MRSPLRQLAPRVPARTAAIAPPWAFQLGLASVVVHLLISTNLMALAGVNYSGQGGNPLVKLHPGTFLALAGAALVLFSGRRAEGLRRLYHDTPALATFLTLIPILAVYSVISVGFSGVAVYIESYLAPGLVVLALSAGTPRQLRLLGYTVLGIALLQVGVSVAESLTRIHLIPMNIGDEEYEKLMRDMEFEDFRGAALYDHPLTGALVTSLAVFMLLGMRLPVLPKAAAFAVLLTGLLAFGGRAAMGITLALVITGTVGMLLRGLLTRRLSGGLLAAVVAGVVLLPLLFLILVSTTDIGIRIVTHLYVDDSVEVRNVQWDVLQLLDFRDVLFGVTPERLTLLKYQIGLNGATTDIENFWLLTFLSLGIIGFGVYLIAFFSFIVHLGRRVQHPLGWTMLLALIVIDSTSNSLGRKAADLVFLAGCILPLSGFAEMARQKVVRMRPRFALAAALSRPGGLQPGAAGAAHTYRLGSQAKRRSFFSLAGTPQS